jgi:hypothetical protein
MIIPLIVACLHGASIFGVGARNLDRSNDFLHPMAAVVVTFAGAVVALLRIWELATAGWTYEMPHSTLRIKDKSI